MKEIQKLKISKKRADSLDHFTLGYMLVVQYFSKKCISHLEIWLKLVKWKKNNSKDLVIFVKNKIEIPMTMELVKNAQILTAINIFMLNVLESLEIKWRFLKSIKQETQFTKQKYFVETIHLWWLKLPKMLLLSDRKTNKMKLLAFSININLLKLNWKLSHFKRKKTKRLLSQISVNDEKWIDCFKLFD